MNLLIVDDHTLFREGLVSLIEKWDGFTVVGEAGTVAEAIELARQLKPDLILMDYSLPDGTGLEATKVIQRELPNALIVFLTVHDDDEELFAAIRSGARGYILKNVPMSNLLLSLDALRRGEPAISRFMTTRILEKFAEMIPAAETRPPEFEKLTNREVELLSVLKTGATNREIAQTLSISERTVKNHVSHILSKLSLKNRYQAARFAQRYNVVPPSDGHDM